MSWGKVKWNTVNSSKEFTDRHNRFAEQMGGTCPIESGALLNLADNECVHGNIPSVRHPRPDCHCFDEELDW